MRSEVGVAKEGRDPFVHVHSEVSTFDKESGGTVYSAGVVGHLARVLGRVSGFDSVKLQGARRGIFSYEIRASGYNLLVLSEPLHSQRGCSSEGCLEGNSGSWQNILTGQFDCEHWGLWRPQRKHVCISCLHTRTNQQNAKSLESPCDL